MNMMAKAKPQTSQAEPRGTFFAKARTSGSGQNLPFFQPKLEVGAPGDVFEQEADRVADQVMRMAETSNPDVIEGAEHPSVQMKCAGCEEEDDERVRMKSEASSTPEVGSSFEAGMRSLDGTGRSLSSSERNFFEPRLGHDFSSVRVHEGGNAAGLAGSINARAFTMGSDVVFGGKDSSSDRQLLTHELVHVVQQGRAPEANPARKVDEVE